MSSFSRLTKDEKQFQLQKKTKIISLFQVPQKRQMLLQQTAGRAVRKSGGKSEQTNKTLNTESKILSYLIFFLFLLSLFWMRKKRNTKTGPRRPCFEPIWPESRQRWQPLGENPPPATAHTHTHIHTDTHTNTHAHTHIHTTVSGARWESLHIPKNVAGIRSFVSCSRRGGGLIVVGAEKNRKTKGEKRNGREKVKWRCVCCCCR